MTAPITPSERAEIRAECRPGDYHGDRELRLLTALEVAEAEADFWRARAEKAERVVVPRPRGNEQPYRTGRA